jgi:hypothetical protein
MSKALVKQALDLCNYDDEITNKKVKKNKGNVSKLKSMPININFSLL